MGNIKKSIWVRVAGRIPDAVWPGQGYSSLLGESTCRRRQDDRVAIKLSDIL